jgi:diaminopimelate epimerase
MIDTGAPHAIVMIESLPPCIAASIHDLPVDELGAAIRNHKAFSPDGTNVTFMTVQHVVHIRTFERGVEAETMACGTGTLAAAIAANVLAGVPSPVTLRTRGGDTLVAGLDPAGSGPANPGLLPRGMYLEGPAKLVFTGHWTVDA